MWNYDVCILLYPTPSAHRSPKRCCTFRETYYRTPYRHPATEFSCSRLSPFRPCVSSWFAFVVFLFCHHVLCSTRLHIIHVVHDGNELRRRHRLSSAGRRPRRPLSWERGRDLSGEHAIVILAGVGCYFCCCCCLWWGCRDSLAT